MFLLNVVIPILTGKINWTAVRECVASAQDHDIQPTVTFNQQQVNGVRVGFHYEPDIRKQLKTGRTVSVLDESNKDDSLVLSASPLKRGWGLSFYQAVKLRLDPVTREVTFDVNSRRDRDGNDNRVNYFGVVKEDGMVDIQRFACVIRDNHPFYEEEAPRPATGSEISDILPTLQGRAKLFAQLLREQKLLEE